MNATKFEQLYGTTKVNPLYDATKVEQPNSRHGLDVVATWDDESLLFNLYTTRILPNRATKGGMNSFRDDL